MVIESYRITHPFLQSPHIFHTEACGIYTLRDLFQLGARFRRAARLIGLCYVVVKVALLLVIEIVAFPVMCGYWIDLCSLSLFDASLKDRQVRKTRKKESLKMEVEQISSLPALVMPRVACFEVINHFFWHFQKALLFISL